MFIGTFYHTLEDNARVSLPASFRSLATAWVLTRGLDGGLFLFTESDFASEVAQYSKTSFTKKTNRDFLRYLTNEATSVTPDANGRIRIPERLLNKAHLTKDVVITGSMNRIEIWDRDEYHTYQDALDTKAEEIAEAVEVTS